MVILCCETWGTAVMLEWSCIWLGTQDPTLQMQSIVVLRTLYGPKDIRIPVASNRAKQTGDNFE